MCADARRIGVLGGTFDPVHLGHLAAAREAARALQLDKVLLVLSARPPHKDEAGAAPAAMRWRMLELAVAADAARHGDHLLEACDVEMQRDAPSWTVDTLALLQSRYPDGELFLLLGSDAYAEVDTWSRPERLLELAHVVVIGRPGSTQATATPLPPIAAREACRYDPRIAAHVHRSGHRLRALAIDGLEASSSEVRSRIRKGESIRELTGPDVARYVREHGLYLPGAGGDGPSKEPTASCASPRRIPTPR